VKERGKSKRRKFAGGQTYTPWKPGNSTLPTTPREDDDPDDDFSSE
jgi:hypothetical protein